MSILDIIAGRKPLIRPTMKSRINSIEQDYALLASRGGGPHYITGRGQKYSRECNDPTYSAIEPNPVSYSPEAVQAMMGNRKPSDLEYVTVQLTVNANTLNRDIPFNFGRPWAFFMIASITDQYKSSNIYVHLKQLGLPASGPGVSNAIVADGTENWIPINSGGATLAVGKWFRFGVPVSLFYADIDHPAGAIPPLNLTILGTNDLIDASVVHA